MKLLLLFFCLAFSLGAEPVRSFESTWSVRQSLSPDGWGSGVGLTASVSGFLLPGLWTGVSAGAESLASWTGDWRSLGATGTVQAGLQVPWGRGWLAVPWVGLGPCWQVLAGLDAEVRFEGRLHGVVGLSVTSDRALVVSLGLRDRTSWRPPGPDGPSSRVTVGPDGLTLKFETAGGSPSVLWSWWVEGPGGQVFYRQAGEGPAPRDASWPGTSLWGEALASATRYEVVLKVTDALGRVTESRAGFETGLVVLREGALSVVRLPRPRDEDPLVLDRLAALVAARKGPVTVTGHTALVQWLNPVRAREENAREALPETLRWAQALKAGLAARGIPATEVDARGLGGTQPLVPFGDGDNAWKNRRIEVSWVPADPAAR